MRNSPLLLAIGGMCAMASAFGFSRFVYTPILPHMAAGLQLSAAQAGLIASANFLGYLIGAFAGASGPVRRHAYAFFALGLAAGALAMAGMAFDYGAWTLAAFCFWRFVGGLVSAFVIVCLASLVQEPVIRAGRPAYASAPFAGVGLGIAGSSVMVLLATGAGGDWRTMWLAAAGGGLALAIAAIALTPRPRPAPRTAAAMHGDGAAPRGALARLVVSYGLFGFGYVITATFLVVIVRETPALRPVEPLAWIVVGLSGAASIPFWTWVARRTGDHAAYALGMIAEAVGVALTVLVPSPLAVLAGGALLGGTFMAVTAVGLGLARRMSPGAPQKAQAIMSAAFGMGQIVGPLVAGVLREQTGSYLWPSLAAALALAVGAVLPKREKDITGA